MSACCDAVNSFIAQDNLDIANLNAQLTVAIQTGNVPLQNYLEAQLALAFAAKNRTLSIGYAGNCFA